MLSALRLRLTLLYLAIGLTFLLLVGAGSYSLLRGYYASSTDLALQHRLVGELRLLGMSVPPDLAADVHQPVDRRRRGVAVLAEHDQPVLLQVGGRLRRAVLLQVLLRGVEMQGDGHHGSLRGAS